MSIETFRAKSAHDRAICDAIARAVGPGLLDMIEGGQRFNDPAGFDYRDMNDDRVYHLVRIIADYRNLMSAEHEGDEYDRATAALACGHGYNLTDSCPMCDNNRPPTPGCLPLIALVRTYDEDGDES